MAGFFIVTACSQYSDSMFGDYQDTSKCPANGCANKAASASLIKLTNGGSTVTLYPGSADTKVEVSGTCAYSTYPTNKINVTVVTQSGSTPVSAPAYAGNSATTQPSCVKGKFDIVVDIRNLAVSAIYTLKLELVAYDSANTAYTNAGGGYLYLNIVR